MPPYSYETALNVTDKSRMKKIMWENDIPTSRYVMSKNLEEALKAGLRYPVVVKLVDSNGSRGVHRVNNEMELQHYFPKAQEAGRNKDVVIEEYVDGIEVSFYYYIQIIRLIS